MTLDELVQANLGKSVEVEDPSNLNQCYDWFFAYCDALNIPRSSVRHLRAYEIFTLATDETRKYWSVIPYDGKNRPQKGDVVLFGQIVGPSGHVCIASGNIDENAKTFQSTDQNWNGHPFVEYIWHTFNGVLGWLRPTITVNVESKTFETLVTKSTKYDSFQSAGYNSVDDVIAKLSECAKSKEDMRNDLQKQIDDLKRVNDGLTQNVKDATDRNQRLLDEMAKIQQEDSTALDEGRQAQYDNDAFRETMDDIAKKLKTQAKGSEILNAIDTLYMQIELANKEKEQEIQKVVKEHEKLINYVVKNFTLENTKGVLSWLSTVANAIKDLPLPVIRKK